MKKQMNRQFDALLNVCVHLGFCGCIKDGEPLHVTDFIPAEGTVTADQFVEWVFLADNLNPNLDPKRWKKIRNTIRGAFVFHMGADATDAKNLWWFRE